MLKKKTGIRERIEYTALNKLTKQEIRKDIRKTEKRIERILEKTGSTKK